MNNWLVIVLFVIVASFLLEFVVSLLNLKSLDPLLPKEFDSIFSREEYQRSQNYTLATTRFSLAENSCSTLITILFILLGGFNYVDVWSRGFHTGEITTGLIFTSVLCGLSFLLKLPFSLYSTFVIEEKFGFNRTTVQTYLLDILKGTVLAIILGGPLLALIFWFFLNTGIYGWLYCWIGVVLFSLIIQYLAPILIMPLFNKFTPIDHGLLKDKIYDYSQQQGFHLKGIFTMDGSKRSSKLNAFFTGFGKYKKIVFFDTLLKKLSEDEIVAVLAHEMGHFKLKHILKMVIASILNTGILFYLLSLFLRVPEISMAFGVENTSIYSSLIFFGFIYSPFSMLVSIFFNVFSRKHEFEADNYAAATTKKPQLLVSSLKKLSKANLSNLTPHPFYVFIHYSHPPLLQRITNLENKTY